VVGQCQNRKYRKRLRCTDHRQCSLNENNNGRPRAHLTLQEKFKREFRMKLRHFRRGHYGKSDTTNHGRSPSVRSTTLSEWKRGYSTRTKRTNLNEVTKASPRRDELEMYVYKSGKITLVKCGSHSDLEELCL